MLQYLVRLLRKPTSTASPSADLHDAAPPPNHPDHLETLVTQQRHEAQRRRAERGLSLF